MTPDKANRIIAEAVGEPWCGAMGRYTYGGGWSLNTIVDFTDSAFTLRLIQWAAKQGWWGKTNKHGCCCLDSVDGYLTDFTGGDVTLEWVATCIRDLVAEAIQERSDG